MRHPGPTTAVTVMLASAVLAGCAADPTRGWSTTSVWSDDIRTVSVGLFANATPDRDFEFDFTDALIKEIEARTPYKVTAPGRADTMVTGRIRRVEHTQLSKSTLTGLSEEVTVSVTIDLSWIDLRTGETLLELESFTANSLFVPSNPTREPIELGEFGAAQRLAHDVVTEMQTDW
ncbi:MAG: LptE family protein [Phycisphaerales bacterium]